MCRRWVKGVADRVNFAAQSENRVVKGENHVADSEKCGAYTKRYIRRPDEGHI